MASSSHQTRSDGHYLFGDFPVIVVAGLLTLTLAAHAYVGYFSRYMADDYCTAAMLRTSGLLNTQRQFYSSWSGRFSFTLTVSVIERFGTWVVPYLPTAALIFWLAVLTWTICQFRPTLFRRRRLLFSFSLATLIVSATVADNEGGVYEALYWQTGMITYVVPLIILSAYAGIARRILRGDTNFKRLLPLLFFSFAAMFYAGGFSETYSVFQAALLLICLAASLFSLSAPFKGKLQYFFCAGLIGSILALAIVSLSPGNKVRQAALPMHSDWLSAATRSLLNASAFLFSQHNYPGTLMIRVAALLLPALLAFYLSLRGKAVGLSNERLWLLSLPVNGLVLIFFCFLPASYALSKAPPSRALITAQFVLIRLNLRLKLLLAALAFVSITPAIAASMRTFAQADKACALARLWDKEAALIRSRIEQGESSLTVPVIYNIGGTDLLSKDPNWYVNQCMATYYGAVSFSGVPGGEGLSILYSEPKQKPPRRDN